MRFRGWEISADCLGEIVRISVFVRAQVMPFTVFFIPVKQQKSSADNANRLFLLGH